jgi:hypothetical protein
MSAVIDPHKQQAASLLGRADHAEHSQPLLLEALVHAVLHLADVIDIREAVLEEGSGNETVASLPLGRRRAGRGAAV